MVKNMVICDMCGREMGEFEEYMRVEVRPVKAFSSFGNAPVIYKYDVCKECYEERIETRGEDYV